MSRSKILLISISTVVLLGLAVGYFVYARAQSLAAIAGVPSTAPAEAAKVLSGPHVVFRNNALGADLGRLAAVALADPGGPRAILGPSCERSYATKVNGVCVFAKRGVVQTYGLSMLDRQLEAVDRQDLVGLPSRARMSADGTLVSTTTFITGHSYAAASFSTETIIRRDDESLGNLELWRTTVDGRLLEAIDRNYWGVTFADDDDTFYATVASGGKTWLVRGSVGKKTMTSMRTDAECPSLSPDGTKIAYKKRLGNHTPGVWKLAVLDLASGEELVLPESRSVDDQVEWLDDDRLLYAMSRPGTEATTSDVWVLPADGSGQPAIFIPQASSPAVIR